MWQALWNLCTTNPYIRLCIHTSYIVLISSVTCLWKLLFGEIKHQAFLSVMFTIKATNSLLSYCSLDFLLNDSKVVIQTFEKNNWIIYFNMYDNTYSTCNVGQPYLSSTAASSWYFNPVIPEAQTYYNR